MKRDIKLIIPRLRPTNGRIMLQLESKEIQKAASGIIIPNAPAVADDNKGTKNPDNYDYFVVAFAPEVYEQLKVFNKNYIPDFVSEPERTRLAMELGRIKLGDQIVLSENFEVIKHYEVDKALYGLIHWLDILGIYSRNDDVSNESNLPPKPEKLTLDNFLGLKEKEPFMMGSFVDGKGGLMFDKSGKKYYWVAIKGINNWSVKYSEDKDISKTIKDGKDLKAITIASQLFDCSDKVLSLFK
jgi:co-chaperonin GroES (HSP10)